MKSATIPTIRVAPELREAAEQMLEEGESLSSFAEQSLRLNIARRRAQKTFVERGLAARTAARENNEYFEAADVLAELDELISDADERDPDRLIK